MHVSDQTAAQDPYADRRSHVLKCAVADERYPQAGHGSRIGKLYYAAIELQRLYEVEMKAGSGMKQSERLF